MIELVRVRNDRVRNDKFKSDQDKNYCGLEMIGSSSDIGD